MKLYKYRSPNRLEHLLDIVVNEQLHCAAYDMLNDPFEGLFMHVMQMHNHPLMGLNTFGLGSRQVKAQSYVSDLPISGNTRICSLSSSSSDVRLWSHYAEGHSGVAIEIEIPDGSEELYKVDYIDEPLEHAYGLLSQPDSTDILRFKSTHWGYEKEYRIITDKDYYSINGRITGIHLGLRASEILKDSLLRVVPDNVPIYSTTIKSESFSIKLNKSLNSDVLTRAR